MNPDREELEKVETSSERALRDWKNKVPVNRAQRRDQLSRYKYYLELNESQNFWSIYGVRKDGNRFMIDNSANHGPKEKPEIIDVEPELNQPLQTVNAELV